MTPLVRFHHFHGITYTWTDDVTGQRVTLTMPTTYT